MLRVGRSGSSVPFFGLADAGYRLRRAGYGTTRDGERGRGNGGGMSVLRGSVVGGWCIPDQREGGDAGTGLGGEGKYERMLEMPAAHRSRAFRFRLRLRLRARTTLIPGHCGISLRTS